MTGTDWVQTYFAISYSPVRPYRARSSRRSVSRLVAVNVSTGQQDRPRSRSYRDYHHVQAAPLQIVEKHAELGNEQTMPLEQRALRECLSASRTR